MGFGSPRRHRQPSRVLQAAAVAVLVAGVARGSVGVAWEVLEFAARGLAETLGVDAVLVRYGLEDTVTDLVFDAVGALLVAAFATRRLGGLVDAATAWLDRVY
jgi:hypothetical protein